MRNYTALQGVRGRADYEEGACGAEGPARGVLLGSRHSGGAPAVVTPGGSPACGD